jgi:dephospho-CoA kinase
MGLGIFKLDARPMISSLRGMRARGPCSVDGGFTLMIRSLPTQMPRAGVSFPKRPVPVLGLTGGVGGGKSEVARLLQNRGAVVIDADAVGHEVLRQDDVRDQLVERFGAEVLSPEGSGSGPAAIDRSRLGSIVFADSGARHDLESILHPRMRGSFITIIDREARSAGAAGSLVVLDAAILFEAGWDDLCDLIVFVDALIDERRLRVERQRGWSPAMFEAREEAQWPCDRKRGRADLVIANDAGIDALTCQVEEVLTYVAELSSPLIEASRP